MNVLTQILSIANPILVTVLLFTMKLMIKKQVDLKFERGKKILETRYKLLYDEKVNLISKLELPGKTN